MVLAIMQHYTYNNLHLRRGLKEAMYCETMIKNNKAAWTKYGIAVMKIGGQATHG